MKKKQIKDSCGTVIYWISDPVDHTKDTIFFLHGLTADHTMFDSQVPFFDKAYNIILWDAPAHGQSRPYEHFTYEKAALAMNSILEEHSIDNVILVGQSMGGMLSQSFISRFPEKAKAFVAIDSVPYGDYYSASDMWWLRQVEWMAKLYPEKLLKKAMADTTALSKAGKDNMRKMLSPYGKRELCHLMGIGYGGFLEDNRNMTIPCPVLLLLGEKDRTGKVLSYNKEWTKRTGYPLVWIKNAAHNSNVDQPETVNNAVQNFLNQLPR